MKNLRYLVNVLIFSVTAASFFVPAIASATCKHDSDCSKGEKCSSCGIADPGKKCCSA